VISNVVVDELERCKKDKQERLFRYLSEVDYTRIAIDSHDIEIASKFVELDILSQKSFDDCQHIAGAITSGCDIIVSWNFQHIVNHKTMTGVKAISTLGGYNSPLIYTPSILIGGE